MKETCYSIVFEIHEKEVYVWWEERFTQTKHLHSLPLLLDSFDNAKELAEHYKAIICNERENGNKPISELHFITKIHIIELNKAQYVELYEHCKDNILYSFFNNKLQFKSCNPNTLNLIAKPTLSV